MKKRVAAMFFLVLLIIPIILSATPQVEFKKRLQSAAFYAENYEAGNPDYDYAKLLIYLYTAEEDQNALLKIKETNKITTDNLKEFLGEPEYTYWVLESNTDNEIQLDDSVPLWLDKVIYDGTKIQIKLNVVPYILASKEIFYKSKYNVVFKREVSTEDIINKVPELERLAKTYALQADDEEQSIQSGNELAELASNIEVVAAQLFKQSDDPYRDLVKIFGEEALIKEEKVTTKEYQIYENSRAILSICESCEGVGDDMWLKLDFEMYNDKGDKIRYYLDPVDTFPYETMGINALKLELINSFVELTTLLGDGKYSDAFNLMNRITILSEFFSDKVNEGNENEVIGNFVDASQFYAGLFEGVPLVKTSFYTQKKFQKVIYTEAQNTTKKEVCNNGIDDNKDNFTDCEEEFCSGQVCGTKDIIEEGENGTLITNQVNLYCISGMCQEKKVQTDKVVGPICGNNVCEEGEQGNCTDTISEGCQAGTCPSDCGIECTQYPPLECNGEVTFSGYDQYGCPLEPICVEKKETCSTNLDCTKPLCGVTVCEKEEGKSTGVCKITQVEQCSQPKCIDGEKKVCDNIDKEIITEICKLGVWEKTGEQCSLDQTSEVKEESNKVLVKQTECPDGKVWSATKGECTVIAQNAVQTTKEKELISVKTIGNTMTGFAVDLGVTGSNVISTGNPITGITHDPDVSNPDVLKTPTTLPPPRVYNDEESAVKITGILGDPEEEIIPSTEPAIPKTQEGHRALPAGMKNVFILEGSFIEEQKSKEASLEFVSAGEDFNGIAALIDIYRKEGVEGNAWKLDNIRKQHRELVDSINNNDFGKFYERYLLSRADSSAKKKSILRIYEHDYDLIEEMARLMDSLKIRTIDWDENDFINMQYSSDVVELNFKEALSEAKFPGMRFKIEVPALKSDIKITYPKDFIMENYRLALEGNSFPSSNLYRSNNYGLTAEEESKIKSNAEIMYLIKKLSSGVKDGSYDFEVTFVQGENENIVYNIFVSLSDNADHPVKIYPMIHDEIPVVDARVKLSADAIYDLFLVSESSSSKYTQGEPGISKGFSLTEQFKKLLDYIDTNSKISDFRSSMEVSPDNSDLKDLIEKGGFLLLEPSKPNDTAE